MPIITIRIWVEKYSEKDSKKHYLNHQDYEVISSKEDDDLFAMAIKNEKELDK